MIRVAIVDDQVLFRESLIYLLGQDPDIQVVASGKNGFDAIDICRKHKPDVLLLDIMMQDMDGLKATDVVLREWPQARILMLTTFEDSDSIITALTSGVYGFIVKDVNPKVLISAIRGVANGLYILHESAHNLLLEDLKARSEFTRRNFADKPDHVHLNDVDLDIIRQLAIGRNNREIAQELNFSEGTIKNRISRLLSEFQLKDRSQIVVMALKRKLI